MSYYIQSYSKDVCPIHFLDQQFSASLLSVVRSSKCHIYTWRHLLCLFNFQFSWFMVSMSLQTPYPSIHSSPYFVEFMQYAFCYIKRRVSIFTRFAWH